MRCKIVLVSVNSMLYSISRLVAKGIFSSAARPVFDGLERIPVSGPCILAANHVSHFDPPLLSVACPRPVVWMAMRELFSHGAAAWYLRHIGAFPLDRAKPGPGSFRTALARLRAGECVGMFPEGGLRSGRESVLSGAKPKPGFAALAWLAGAPVIPCLVLGSDRLYAPSAWGRWKGGALFALFGPALERLSPGIPRSEALAGLERAWLDALAALLARARELGARDEDLPQTAARRKGREPLPA